MGSPREHPKGDGAEQHNSFEAAAAGEPWANTENRRQKTSQCKEFSTSKGQEWLQKYVLACVKLYESSGGKKKSRFCLDTPD